MLIQRFCHCSIINHNKGSANLQRFFIFAAIANSKVQN